MQNMVLARLFLPSDHISFGPFFRTGAGSQSDCHFGRLCVCVCVCVCVCLSLFFFSFKSLFVTLSQLPFIFRKYQERKYHQTSMTDATCSSPDTSNIPAAPRTQPPPNSLQTVEYSLGPTQKARRNYLATQYHKRQLNA